MNAKEWLQKINSGAFDEKFKYLYGVSEAMISRQRIRYTEVIEQFMKLFPKREDIHVYSAPGRTEIGGNHTDHQHGCVLAAAVNLDVI